MNDFRLYYYDRIKDKMGMIKKYSALVKLRFSQNPLLSPLKQLFIKSPGLLYNAIHRLSDLVNTLGTELIELKTLSLSERVLTTLIRNCNSKRELNFSHEELAQLVGASRTNISRELKQLEKKGVIRLERRKIIIK